MNPQFDLFGAAGHVYPGGREQIEWEGPLGHVQQRQRYYRDVWVTVPQAPGLIAINILAFCAQKLVGEELTLGFSLIPKEITTLTDLTKPERVQVKVPGTIRLANG